MDIDQETITPLRYTRDALLNLRNHRSIDTVHKIAPDLLDSLLIFRQRGKRGGKNRKAVNLQVNLQYSSGNQLTSSWIKKSMPFPVDQSKHKKGGLYDYGIVR